MAGETSRVGLQYIASIEFDYSFYGLDAHRHLCYDSGTGARSVSAGLEPRPEGRRELQKVNQPSLRLTISGTTDVLSQVSIKSVTISQGIRCAF
jgi:hypothetical protein